MKEHHVSLVMKANILIVVIILVISSSLVLISDSAYRQAVFQPYLDKLADCELPLDELTPALQYFSTFMGTEDLKAARAFIDTDNDKEFAQWLNAQITPPEVSELTGNDAGKSLLNEWISFNLIIEAIQASSECSVVCVEIQKGGTVYLVSRVVKGIDTYRAHYRFGSEEAYTDQAPSDYTIPGLLKTKGSDEYVWTESFTKMELKRQGKGDAYARCIQIELEGAEGRIWLAYNMTELFQEHRSFLIRSVLSVLGLTLAASFLSAFLLRNGVTRPISRLAEATTGFVPGPDGMYSADRISRVEIRSHDEIGELSRDIRSMQEQIVESTRSLTEMTAEKERIRTELSMANRIQESMLPSIFPAYPDRPEFDLFASMDPAKEVGGDFYDFFLVDDDHLALVMADVSGKGVPAALFMMVSKTILKNSAMMGKSAGEILTVTNEMICSNNRMQMFVTVWFGILEISTGRIVAANAGHEYPALRRSGGGFELYKDRHGFVLGGMEGVHYKEYELILQPGDKLFLYTDGVPEATGNGREFFGTERMIDALTNCADARPKDILAGVRSAVDTFTGDAEQFDDLTMMCLEYRGASPVGGKG